MRTVRENISAEEMESFQSNGEEEDEEDQGCFSRQKLDVLLEEQSKKNEMLSDKNIRLTAQQRSLLALLQKKDDMIKRVAEKAEKRKKFKPGLRILEGVIDRRYKGVIRFVEFAGLEMQIKEKALGYLNTVRNSAIKGMKREGLLSLRQYKVKYNTFLRFLAVIKTNMIRAAFIAIRSIKYRNYLKNIEATISVSQGLIMISNIFQKRRIVVEYFHHWKSALKNKNKILCWKIKKHFRRTLFLAFQHIKISNINNKIIGVENENKSSSSRCLQFMNKFVILSTLCEIRKKTDLILLKNFMSKLKHLKTPSKSPIPLILNLKRILQKRFCLIFLKPPNPLILHIFSNKLHSTLHHTFHSILHSSAESTLILLKQNFLSSENAIKTLSESLQALQISLTELKTDAKYLSNSREKNSHLKLSLTNDLDLKEQQCSEIQRKIAQNIEEIKKYQNETESRVSHNSQICTRLMQEVEFNNKKIEELENSIEYYCNEIMKNENEGRASALQFTQLQASYKKAQEMYTVSISDKNRLQALEMEAKKQKIFLAGKIDSFSEEKEGLIEKLNNNSAESSLITEQIHKKIREYEEFKTVLHELQDREENLIQKKRALQINLDEECDLKNSLLFHKQNEARKLKDAIATNKIQIDSLVKDLKSTANQGEMDKQAKTQEDYNNIYSKVEEISKEIRAESNKHTSLVAYSQKLVLKKQQFLEEYKNISELLSNISEENNILYSQISNVETDQKRSITEDPGDSIESLSEYANSLEINIKELTVNLSQSPECETYAHEKIKLENKIKSLQSQLNGCNEFAIKSRKDVAEAISEIENYANILVVMEEKMNETEEKLSEALREKDIALEEAATIRQQYYSLISGSKRK